MNTELLLQIAKDIIVSKFDTSIKVNREKLKEEYKFLNKKAATFVTLYVNEKLRGCVGSLEPSHSLIDDLIANANNAAFHDPRFYELSHEEFLKIKIEISILSEAKLLEYKDKEDLKSKIKVNVHGVILKDGIKRATFLPQVWEELETFELFFSALCQKANLEKDCLSSHPNIYTYEVKKIK